MDLEIAKAQEERKKLEQELASEQMGSLDSVTFDTDLYGCNNRFEGFEKSIPVSEDDENIDSVNLEVPRRLASYTAPKSVVNDVPSGGDDDEALKFRKPKNSYLGRRLDRVISLERNDAFASGDKTPDVSVRTFADIMREGDLKRKEEENLKLVADKKEGKLAVGQATRKRKSSWDLPDSTPGLGRWDVTLTPNLAGLSTPTPKRQRSRWDETPANMGIATPMAGAISAATYTPGVTPFGGVELSTPTPGAINLRGAIPLEQHNLLRWEKDIEDRNHPFTDEELDSMFPQGYTILDPPGSYVPIRTPARKLLSAPTPMTTPLYAIPEENRGQRFDVPKELSGGLPLMKPEDYKYFGALLNEEDEEELSSNEQKERKLMKLLLKVKNGTPPQRKAALRQLTDKAREFGAGPLFTQILPLLMEATLEDQERHLLVKVIDRVLYKLDELVRPFVHKILVVIEPFLIEEDFYACVEGREIISNLSKAAGLATMIAAMRPDIDHPDEYVRNTTARAFSVVATALGVPALLPFLKAVCQSKKSWQARHTGIKTVQQIAIQIGCAVLPHLRSLVEIIKHGLNDENQKVKTITALSLAALAEASAPYGIESFDSVLKPLWMGIRSHRGKVLAAFLKAIGFIRPLMEAIYASYYTKEVMVTLVREFESNDLEMKKIVLKVVKQCVSTEGVEADYIRRTVLPEFFRNYWVRKMALDRRNYKQLVETTVEIASKVGAADIVGRIVEDLKDESEPYRRMVMETIEKVVADLGASDIDARLEELLIDGILYAFQMQTSDDANVMLNGFGAVVNSLGQRVKSYLPQIFGTIKWRLNYKCKGETAGSRSRFPDCSGHETVSGGATHGTSWCCLI